MPLKYQGILCDLFNTLLVFDLKKLPTIVLKGREIPSTAPHLLPLLKSHLPQLTAEYLHQKIMESRQQNPVGSAFTEVDSSVHFACLLDALEVDLSPERRDVLSHRLALTHTRQVCRCAGLPDAHRNALKTLAERFDLALVSNFDYGQAVHERLEELGLREQFKAIVISADLGIRKPAPLPFMTALKALNLAKEQALFVGDSPGEDLKGAAEVGIDMAWINAKGKECAPDLPRPRYEIANFAQLPSLLDF